MKEMEDLKRRNQISMEKINSLLYKAFSFDLEADPEKRFNLVQTDTQVAQRLKICLTNCMFTLK